MKSLLLGGLVTVVVCFPMAASAQGLTAYVLETDFSVQDRVIELDVPPGLDGVPFMIGWNTGNGQYSRMFIARAGTHCYELRTHAQWQGQVQAVAATLMGVPGRLKTPTSADEIDMFLGAEPIAPGTINFVLGRTLFGWSWNTWLLLILLVSALCFSGFKSRPFAVSLALGALVSWGVTDLLTLGDHFSFVRKTSVYREGIFPLTDVKAFADQAAPMIGKATWGHGPLDGIDFSFLQYRLAEHSYVPEGSDRPPTFWITKDPNDGQVVLQHAIYYLVKKNQP